MAKLIKNNAYLQGHEEDSIKALLDNGFDVELIVPSHTPHNNNPDLLLNEKIWELKTPITSKKDSLERKIKKGSKQSENIIVDIRFCRVPEPDAIRTLTKRFRNSRKVKSLLIITSGGRVEKIMKK